jgi:gluconate:H+ symporter, GntP family
MGGVAALIGIPLFFEVGVVLLVPIVLLVARHTQLPVLPVGIPALAGLSVLHGLVPPHPGRLVAIDALGADLGRTLLFGLIAAIPCVIIASPVFGTWISRRLDLPIPALLGNGPAGGSGGGSGGDRGPVHTGTDLGDPTEAEQGATVTETAVGPAGVRPKRQPGSARRSSPSCCRCCSCCCGRSPS